MSNRCQVVPSKNYDGKDSITAISNATVQKICYGYTEQINIYARDTAHVIIDVLGYFARNTATRLNTVAGRNASTVGKGKFYAVYSPYCPSNYSLTGGGCSLQYADARDGLEADRPSPSTGPPTRWECRGYNREAYDITVTAHVVCAQIPGR
jgi:hypothetical protein